VTKGDQLVERGATRLQELADRAAARGDGIGEWLSEELRNDAAFLRKLKPSLVKARATRNGATNEASANPEPEAPPPGPPPQTPVAESQPTETQTAPPPKPKPKKKPKKRRGGPPPVVIVGAAFVVGIVLAKIIDWRGHAHPRD
jgi:outer membrane biosynthesis protein TonB